MNLSETEAAVRALLSDGSNDFYRFLMLEKTDSTNNRILTEAAGGAAEGLTVCAVRQTAGKGSRGRSFFSAAPCGLYFSVLFRPPAIPPENLVRITAAAAVAVCSALEACGSEEALIKWVNDVYINRRKVCGILTEGRFSAAGRLEAVVCGIGLNLAAPPGGFPSDIAETAGAVFATADEAERQRAAVLAAALESLRTQYLSLQRTGKTGSEEEYRRRSLLIGRTVTVTRQNGTAETATVTDIDKECRLCVRWKATGLEETLIGGDVTLHGNRF